MTIREQTQTIERLTLSPHAASSERSRGRRRRAKVSKHQERKGQ